MVGGLVSFVWITVLELVERWVLIVACCLSLFCIHLYVCLWLVVWWFSGLVWFGFLLGLGLLTGLGCLDLGFRLCDFVISVVSCYCYVVLLQWLFWIWCIQGWFLCFLGV